MHEVQSPPADLAETLETDLRAHARFTLAKKWEDLTDRDLFLATVLAVRDRVIDAMLATEDRYQRANAKRLCYLSMEFLIGRSLDNNLYNLGLWDYCDKLLRRFGRDPEKIRDHEPDAALGNGGLGRLAACFLDSLATMDMPGYGYGINYEYGLFKQEIENGYQREKPDHWRANGTPWQIIRPDESVTIPIYGRVEEAPDSSFPRLSTWTDTKVLIGVPHDMPIVGYGGRTVNVLRLYSARSSQEFDMQIFNRGDYLEAVEQKIMSETVSKVLYPSDAIESGRELRLVQEYFLVACAIRDIVTRYLKRHTTFDQFASSYAIQLNDTHPTLAIVEFMRLLLDEHGLEWDTAWDIVVRTFGYTNHTLLPEALERWPVHLLERVLPRHLQIIREIDRRFLEVVEARWPGDEERKKRMSIFDDGHARMANLAIIGSHSVNGVAALHSELVKKNLVPDFYALWPGRFNNKTNGVSQRRWLLNANPRLADLITRTIGNGWITDLDRLRGLEAYAQDPAFQAEFSQVKMANKERLARVVRETTGIGIDPKSLFDVQVKRIHEYKRQLLCCMHVIHEYLRIVEDGQPLPVPRTYIFAGKAAPGYWAAKQVIKLINNLARVINNDKRANQQLRVVFIPDYRVTLAEVIIPAANLSEQISTAGKEASGTGNMKFAMNGALTMGTLDGANIEIREEVGEDNIFIFGLKAEQIQQMRERGTYNPREYYERDPHVRRVVDAFNSNLFCADEPGLFTWIYQTLLGRDEYFHLADMPSYINAQLVAAKEFKLPHIWTRKAIMNVARIGKFSSDRTIREYAEEIWGLRPV